VKLIELVIEDKLSVYRASRMIGINNATAKDIIRKYKRNGTVFVRKEEMEKYDIPSEQLSQEESLSLQEQIE
jgi:hypothetical protein